MSDKLQQAIDMIKSGNRETGGHLLAEVLKVNSDDEDAWLWMSIVTESDIYRRNCLKEVLRINPNNQQAKKDLENLLQGEIGERSEIGSIGAGVLTGMMSMFVVWGGIGWLTEFLIGWVNGGDNIFAWYVGFCLFPASIPLSLIAGWISGIFVYRKLSPYWETKLGRFDIELLSIALFLVVLLFSCPASVFFYIVLPDFLHFSSMGVGGILSYIIFFSFVAIPFFIAYGLTIKVRADLTKRFS